MSSILLGPLNNTSNKISKNKLNSVYNSDIENNMNSLEREQAYKSTTQYSNPEFLSQFDELRFDNMNEPVSQNQSNITSGINNSLQRNLDFQNGYSEFQNSDMHYGVTNKNNFTHNNMVPNTSRRDFSVSADRSQRRLETFTGVSDTWIPKKEKMHLFEPMADLTWVNGMPSVTTKLQSRYLPSNKNNHGNLPFQNNVKVRPGVEMDNQEGNYAVYRVNPRNVDSLRSEINQKVSYESKPLETIKKGEFRGVDPTLTKYKLPDFREQHFDDLVAGKANIGREKQTGKFTNVQTQRNESTTYNPGHAVNTNMGSGPDKEKTRFEQSKRESYANDSTHAVTAVTNRPVMTNKNSYTNYETQRASTNIDYQGPASNGLGGQGGNYVVDYKDIPLTTLRELMINGNTNIGISGAADKGNYVFSNDNVLPTTKRETISTKNPILGPNPEVKLSRTYDDTDIAKPTIRQYTSHNIVTNGTSLDKQGPIYNNDTAKMTLRQNTSHSIVTNGTSLDKQGPVYNNDKAKATTRPEISHSIITNLKPVEYNCYVELEDQARDTIKQSTLFTTPEINVKGNIESGYTNLQDNARPTIKQSTIISNRQSGNLHNTISNSTYSRDQKDEAKPTLRQQTEETKHIGILTSVTNESTYSRDVNEIARQTIRQQTESTKHIGHANSKNIEGTYVRDLVDKAKTTIRQQTEDTKYIGHVNSSINESTYTRDQTDTAKPTIKQTTIYSTPAGRMNNSNMGNYARDVNDEAKVTTRQTTLLQDYTGGLHGEVDAQISHEAANNMQIDERREISTFNRASNGKGDLNGPYIDPENVRFNDKRTLYSHVSHPHKPLDHSVMPTTSRHTIETVYSMSKPVIETSSYYVNNNFINTLKNNPLVNDIYHQKNV